MAFDFDIFEELTNRWRRFAPRERRMLSALALTFVLCVFGFVGFLIRDGLTEIAARNAQTRAALRLIEDSRDEIAAAKSRPGDALSQIGEEAPSLSTYLESIANTVGVKIPESVEQTPTQKGKFQELGVEIELRGITLRQLADFLRSVETQSQIVVTQKLRVKTAFGAAEKLDARLTVSTYERPRKKAADKGEKTEEPKPAEGEGG